MTLEELLEKENLRNTPMDVFINLKENIDDLEILNEICDHINFENEDTFFTSLKSFLVSYGKKLSPVDSTLVVDQLEDVLLKKDFLHQAQESIISTINRPAFLIRNDRIDISIDTIWKQRLFDGRANINAALPSVGRIELKNHHELAWIGTGWLMKGTDMIVTNRHVAYNFSSRDRGSYSFKKNYLGEPLEVFIDFKEEYNINDQNTFKVIDIIHIAEDDEPNIAIMQIDTTSIEGNDSPDGLEVADYGILSRDLVFTVGYPGGSSMNKISNDLVFNGIYDVKRLAPGIMHPSSAASFIYAHDCSTWRGNSGSPIIDLSSGKVVGVHYAGSNESYRNVYTNWGVRSTYLIELLNEIDK